MKKVFIIQLSPADHKELAQNIKGHLNPDLSGNPLLKRLQKRTYVI